MLVPLYLEGQHWSQKLCSFAVREIKETGKEKPGISGYWSGHSIIPTELRKERLSTDYSFASNPTAEMHENQGELFLYLPRLRGKSRIACFLESWISSSLILPRMKNNSAEFVLDCIRVTTESNNAKTVRTKEKLWNASIVDFGSMALAMIFFLYL